MSLITINIVFINHTIFKLKLVLLFIVNNISINVYLSKLMNFKIYL